MLKVPHLLCVGDLGLDIIIRVPRLPGPDQKVGGREVARGAGGMAANVAVGAMRLGTPARLVATIGDDTTGREAEAHLAREGVDLAHLARRRNAASFYCVILIDPGGEKALVRAAGATFLPDPAALTPAAFEGVAHVHFIHPEPSLLARGIERAHAVGATVSLDLEAADIPDTGGALADLVDRLDLIFLGQESRATLEAMLGPLGDRRDLVVVTTRGAGGAEVAHMGRATSVGGHATAVADTLGAGDALAAAFLHAWLRGASPEAALKFANAAAALSTLRHGAQPGLPREDEIEEFIRKAEKHLA